MSALFVISGGSEALVIHDTLARHPYRKNDLQLRPLNFVTKSVYMPQFKTIISCVGSSKLLFKAFDFFQTKIIGFDVDVAVAIDPGDINKFLYSPSVFGTMVLTGFSNSDQKIINHYIRINKTPEEWKTAESLCFPPYQNEDPGILNFKDISLQDLSIEVMERLRNHDATKPLNLRAGIGGHIVKNSLYIHNTGVIFQSEVIKEFEDFNHTKTIIINKLRGIKPTRIPKKKPDENPTYI